MSIYSPLTIIFSLAAGYLFNFDKTFEINSFFSRRYEYLFNFDNTFEINSFFSRRYEYLFNFDNTFEINSFFSRRRYEYLFNFDNTFEIQDDIEVLKRMGMAYNLEKNQCTAADLQKAMRMVPQALKPYVLGKHLNHTLCQQGVWASFGHPNPQKSTLGAPQKIYEKFLERSISII